MEEIVNNVFGMYAGLVLAVMGVCAAVSSLLPAPKEDSNIVYKIVYKIFNWIGCNFHKAKNADEVAKDAD